MKKFNKKKLTFIGLILFLFLLIAGIVIFDKNRVIDEAIYNFIFNFRTPLLDKYFTFITHFGDTIFIIIFVAIFMLICRSEDSVFLSLSAVNSALMTLIFKHIFVRSRPGHIRLVEQGGYSFPSGHSMISVCVYGYLFYLARKIKNNVLRYIIRILLILLILSVGISRIYVGVHHPTDVIGGYLLGLIGVIFIMEVFNLYKTRGN